MKKSIRPILLGGAFLFALSMSLTSCEGALDDIFGEWDRPGTVTGISLNKTAVTLVVGEADLTLNFTLKPDNAIDKTATWSSDNTAVATVDEKGTVHAVAEGTATITVQAGKKTASCVVTVITIPVVYETYMAWDGTALTAQKVSTSGIEEVTDATTSLHEGFYIVKKDVTISNDIYISEDTKLILCDEATLTINGYIDGTSGTTKHSLTIYGQENQTGKLIVNATTGHNGILVKDLEIHGGDISFTGDNTQGKGIRVEGDFTIYGGKVVANGGETCSGISAGNNITINDGTVVATGGNGDDTRDGGYGIYAGNDITINGGNVTATGKKNSPGIKSAQNINITGGTVSAVAGENGGGTLFAPYITIETGITLVKLTKGKVSDDAKVWIYTANSDHSISSIKLGANTYSRTQWENSSNTIADGFSGEYNSSGIDIARSGDVLTLKKHE